MKEKKNLMSSRSNGTSFAALLGKKKKKKLITKTPEHKTLILFQYTHCRAMYTFSKNK